jgi:hypothetical protein
MAVAPMGGVGGMASGGAALGGTPHDMMRQHAGMGKQTVARSIRRNEEKQRLGWHGVEA